METKFERQLLRVVPRLLTQLDRDSDSPTFGCFDRDFWHYKIRDFASIVLQQGMLVLVALYHHDFPGNIYFRKPVILSLIDGALAFWAAEQLPSGSFNEYYPFEEGFPPTAFSLYAVTMTLQRRGIPPESATLLKSVQKAADWLLTVQEKQALNQEAVALTSLELASRLPGVFVDKAKLDGRLKDFFAAQSLEGWFPEYGGADSGYLSVALDAMSVYYDLTGDERAALAMEKALQFISSLISVAGTTPVMTNSRNTDYVVPYGLIRLAEKTPLARRVVTALFADIEKADHFLHATDDRYLCHYVYHSCFRSLEHLPKMTAAQAQLPADIGADIFYPEAGIHVLHAGGNSSVFIAALKGGVFYYFRKTGLVYADFGWRQKVAPNRVLLTHWQHPDNRAALHKDADSVMVVAEGRVTVHGSVVSTVTRHAALRLLSYLFGNRIIAFLKKRLIFSGSASGISYRREITIQHSDITLTDVFSGSGIKGFVPEPAPAYSLRHVASAANYNGEELFDVSSLQRSSMRTADSLTLKTSLPKTGQGDRSA
jgi:hypothetical protein